MATEPRAVRCRHELKNILRFVEKTPSPALLPIFRYRTLGLELLLDPVGNRV